MKILQLQKRLDRPGGEDGGEVNNFPLPGMWNIIPYTWREG